jgi:hypothetical protein
MGFKNYERWTADDWRRTAETVEAMIRLGWQLRTRCPRCQTVLRADLYQVAATRGPRFGLWNRTTPCRVVDCYGQVEFWTMPREAPNWIRMRTRLPESPSIDDPAPR